MITDSNKIALIEKCFGAVAVSNTGKNASVVCPFCKSSGKITNKKKLSVCIDSGIYHCWVCESKGGNIGKVALKFCKSDIESSKKLIRCFGKTNASKVEDLIKSTISLPEDFTLLSSLKGRQKKSYRAHLSYLSNRGFTEKDLHRFRPGVSEKYEFKNYVIFPSNAENGELNYYVSRTVDPNNNRRYKNCNVGRKEVIFREFDVDFSRELILVEGVFDLINCPENATCILGSWIDENYEIFKKIVKFKTPVVLCFDPDARKKSLQVAKKLSEYCVPVRVSYHKDKDFGDMTKKEVQICINESKQFDFAQSVGYLINNISSGSLF